MRRGQKRTLMARGRGLRKLLLPPRLFPLRYPRISANFAQPISICHAKKRIRFWVGLLSSMAEFESTFDPEAAARGPSKDVFRRRGMNRGLLQISKESANQPGYGCGIKKAKHLHDPAIHLPCAVKILSTWVSADRVIASYKGNKKNRGGGRYWAVLQEKNGRLPAISGFTRNLPFCRKG